jgi:hypothetical protein
VVFLPFGKKAPTWAEVVENFRTLDLSSATVHFKFYVNWSSPLHVELWAGQDDKFRILSGRSVVFGRFGDKEEDLKAYNLANRAEGNLDPTTQKILMAFEAIDESRVDILEAILEGHSGGTIVETTSLIHPNPVFSKDLVVFDAMSKSGRYLIRLWALRESRLPVRILYQGYAGWGHTDVIITYAKSQPEDFFDAEAFAAELEKPSAREIDLMYLFMKDPAGHTIPVPGSKDIIPPIPGT